MKRIEIGEDSLQGIDYTYNINGWLKSINHSDVNHYNGTNGYDYDPGSDGYNSLHNHYVPDYFGMILNYYSGDFSHYNSPLNSPGSIYGERLLNHGLETGNPNKITNLYNGNIPAWEYGFNNKVNSNLVGVADNTILGSTYKYDILNRLRVDNYHKALSQLWGQPSDSTYKSRYSFDPNGNFYNLFRNGPFGNGTANMDNLVNYTYPTVATKRSNRLASLQDLVTTNVHDNTIKDLLPLNPAPPLSYGYDQSGNLTADVQEGISNILWSADGKVLYMQKTGGVSFKYTYDGRGNRVRTDYRYSVDGQFHTKHTFYIRDANGEVLAIYEGESTEDNPRYNVMFSEWLIYGSKSHGRFARTKEPNPSPNSMMYDPTVLYNPALLTGGPPTHTRKLSFKDYELKDHLGDVRLVFSDLKLRPAYGENAFRLDQREASNYYPFGMLMPGLHWNSTSFNSRFAFNGMMKDDGIKGLGNSYNTEFRMYDPRIGRWLSLDPKPIASESWYVGMGNNPILRFDFLGDSSFVFDNNLKYVKNEDDGKKEWSVTVLHEEKNEKGKIIIKPQIFLLNDPEKDSERMKLLIKNYAKHNIQFIFYKSEEDEKNYMKNAGLIKPGSKFDIIGPHLGSFDLLVNSHKRDKDGRGGKYDFWGSQLVPEIKNDHGLKILWDNSAFFITDKKAYNDMDYGNRLWGKATSYLRIPFDVAKWGAEFHNFIMDGWRDDPADQRAIEDGCKSVK